MNLVKSLFVILIMLSLLGCDSKMPKDSEILAEEVVEKQDSIQKEEIVKNDKKKPENQDIGDPVEVEVLRLKLEISDKLQSVLNDPLITDNTVNTATLKQIDNRLNKLIRISAEIEENEKNLEQELLAIKEKKSALIDIFWDLRNLINDLEKTKIPEE